MITSEVRAEVFRRADCRCEKCGKAAHEISGPLHLHHVQYRLSTCWPYSGERDETAQDLLLLCGRCHQHTHSEDLRNNPSRLCTFSVAKSRLVAKVRGLYLKSSVDEIRRFLANRLGKLLDHAHARVIGF